MDTASGGTSRFVAPQRNAWRDWVFWAPSTRRQKCATTAPNRECRASQAGPNYESGTGKGDEGNTKPISSVGPGEQIEGRTGDPYLEPAALEGVGSGLLAA